jgi:hypothetical protein
MYLTVLNKETHLSVPFLLLPNGEVKLNSTNKKDTEDSCIVTLTKIYYEYSMDFQTIYRKV